MRRGETLPFAAFLVASTIWGTTFFVIRIGIESVPPLWSAAVRLAIASALFFVIMGAMKMRLPRGAALKGALLFGLLDFGGAFGLLYWAEQTVPGGVAAVIFATLPLLTGVFAWIMKLELLTYRKLTGAILSFTGVALLFVGELGHDVPLTGLLAVLGAAASMAAGSIVLKRTPPRPVVVTNAIGTAVGFAVCLVASLALGEAQRLPTTVPQWWPILYLAIAGSLGAFSLFTYVNKKWNATSASMVFVVIPVLAVLLDAVSGGHVPPPLALLGTGLVLVGVTVVLLAPNGDAVPQLHRPPPRRRRVPVLPPEAARALAPREAR